ncbi:UBP-type zinc finger domain-containing protein [Demequina sp. SYSU T00039]|uniref:UBP-type zinc finger domain-containing protein n=1 Tax=Demequina lignilytica TaxID=3051663 RepID=A0AAW7M1G9_9MICO|nr:UBP-type zinc finger domain-containing protein [Demequina sp. SYSU T00039]MDN4486580.1 UBP-type zinc finger domain-containing protein [Demequina sp. SYSU T00039]
METATEGVFDTAVPPSGPGCLECEQTGGWWWHLRRCARCGHVGCCDGSLSTHARRHAASTGHPVVQSYEPGEVWFWDYGAESFRDGPTLTPPTSHPEDQTAPGPAERVPADWREILAAR